MDNGAHYFRADFQVHTPRDINWSGNGAVSNDERKSYAEELILACRSKGLHAIAITDHHDFAFFPYIKKASQDEVDDNGQPITAEKQIVVFPGLELTLTSPTCQAILLLDADFPENLLASVLTTLSITPALSSEEKTAQVQRIPTNVVGGLGELYDKLSSLDYLKGRFIVLPNVSERGNGTILRSGFANYYVNMPCVGGYVDGAVTQLGQGNTSIVNGTNREYGFKAIAVIQTSDNRRRDHETLGQHTTWIKWSQPTAEALRQACLAKESRMTHEEPELPNYSISSMSVTQSKFLGRVQLELNTQYNALIGGRGTGKSTLLEYLRWGLCDQPVEDADDDLAPVQVKRLKLIEDTLNAVDGEVHVTFLLNGVRHIVKRNAKAKTVLLRIGDGAFTNATEEETRSLLPIQAYSQKQLSSIGIRVEELKRFVELPVKKTLAQLSSGLHDTATKIRASYGNLIRKQEVDTEVNRLSIEIISVSEQLKNLRKGLSGLSPDDIIVIDQKTKYDIEELIIANLKVELEQKRESLKAIESKFSSGESDSSGEDSSYDTITEEEFQNPDLIKSIQEQFEAKHGEIDSHYSSLVDLFETPAMENLNAKVAEWELLKKDYDVKYEEAKNRASVNQQLLDQIQTTESKLGELKGQQQERRKALDGLGNPEGIYGDLRNSWETFHRDKVSILENQCTKFSTLSDDLIKAIMKKSVDIGIIKTGLKSTLSGMKIREQKIDDLCDRVLESDDPISDWNEVLSELEKLACHKVDETEELPATPQLDSCNFIVSEKSRIATLLDRNKWLTLSLTELEFNPKFRYCTNKATNEYISFADASAGQQATSLLSVLLNQKGAPLIIDQPEDDIDSTLMDDIIGQIWEAKKKRQLVFASHNANFVVNGDAELVVCCDYVNAGDQTGGQIKCTGAIDIAEIKNVITSVTEGGEKAFRLRKEKYGF